MPLLCKLFGVLVANDVIDLDFRWSQIKKSYGSIPCSAIFHFLDKKFTGKKIGKHTSVQWVVIRFNAPIVHTLEAIFAVNINSF